MKWGFIGNFLFLNFDIYIYENVISKNFIIMIKKYVLFILYIMICYIYIMLWSGWVSIVRMVIKWFYWIENIVFCFCGVFLVNLEVCF